MAYTRQILNNRLYTTLQHARNMYLLKQKAFVNGEWVSAASGKVFEVKNPFDGTVVGTVPDMDMNDTQNAIQVARDAFKTWQFTTAKERSDLLRKWYDLLRKNQDEIGKIMTLESGKPIMDAVKEIYYGNSFIEWFSEEVRRSRGDVIPSSRDKKMLVEKEPIGVAALITPWNFPHAMITRKTAAALAAGCTCVIRPSDDTPFTALALAQLADEAGFPKGVVNVVTSGRENTPAIGKLLCESPLVSALSFTGSTQVGKLLYKQCASTVKRIALELGGNAPFIVFDSANIDKAVQGALVAKFRNAGQSCVAANRFFVQDKIYDAFISKFKQAVVENIKVGDVFDEKVNLGPIINKAQFDRITNIVKDAVSKGAGVITGGKPAAHAGELVYEPTILVDITKDMNICHEEVFGPVAAIIRFKTEEEVVQRANETKSGLAGYFFTEDMSQMMRMCRQIEVGMLGVNEGLISAAEAPFGGVKESGVGREGSHYGIEEFENIKYICIGI